VTTFAFVFSTGRCGTKHLAASFGGPDAFVCHEGEHDDVIRVMSDFLRPIAATGDRSAATHFVRNFRIPYMERKLYESDAHKYFDTGHQIIFGIAPALIEELNGRCRFIRLRRNRIDTACSFMAGPEDRDPWIALPRGINTSGDSRPRWAYRPSDKILIFTPPENLWVRWNRFQRYLWFVDEVERQWQRLLASHTFPHMNIDLENLDEPAYQKLAEFLSIPFRRDMIGIRHNRTEDRPGFRRPSLTRAELKMMNDEFTIAMKKYAPDYLTA